MSAVRFPSMHRMIDALQILPTFLSRGRATFVSNVEQGKIWSCFWLDVFHSSLEYCRRLHYSLRICET